MMQDYEPDTMVDYHLFEKALMAVTVNVASAKMMQFVSSYD